jgi:hypothetical protein
MPELEEFRRVSRVNWKIYYLQDRTKGRYDSDQKLLIKVFDINPTSFDIEPQQRVSMEQTMGGVMPISWVGGRNSWNGYDRVILALSGTWNVFVPRDLKIKASEKSNSIIADVMDKIGLSGISRDRYWISVKEKKDTEELLKNLESDRKVESYKKVKAGLLELFYLINQPFVNYVDSKGVAGKWILEIASVVVAHGGDVNSEAEKRRVSFEVVPVAPMVIRERADKPFMPDWTARFAIINEDVRKFFETMNDLAKELNPNRVAEVGV